MCCVAVSYKLLIFDAADKKTLEIFSNGLFLNLLSDF